jgi:mannitol/fructose-specific phosphotransferase system IIA component (Ntr-type)
MKFKDFICFKACISDLQASDRDDSIRKLMKALDKAGELGKAKPDKISELVIKRENEASTGMGKGVAIPHIKNETVKELTAVVGQSKDGIDFSSLDKQPVYSVILLLSPSDKPDMHLQAMEYIFKHLQKEKFRKFLRQATTKKEIKELFEEADTDPSL